MGPPRLNGALLIWPTEKVAEAIAPLSLKVIIFEAVSHKRRRQRAQRGCEEGMKVHCESAAIEHTTRPDEGGDVRREEHGGCANRSKWIQPGSARQARAQQAGQKRHHCKRFSGSTLFEALQRRCCEKSETVWSGHGRLRR